MTLLNSNSGIITDIKPVITSSFTNITLWYESNNGYCCLYKAQKSGKYHILKTLKPIYKDNPVYQGLLQKEFQISYPLSHPHIVQTIGFEEIPGIGSSIIMEYIDGIHLREYLNSKNYNSHVILKILDELCQALSYIHSLQIIHRDLKPENILITRNGSNVKLIDFGLSDTDSYSILKHPAGTLKYASPEQQVPQTTIDNKADIYSLGVILEEIIQTTHVKLPHVHKIIRRCTSELPAQRYTSTLQIIHLLHSKNKYLPYLSVLLITILTTGGLLLGYHWGLKQNVNRYSQSTNIYNQIVQQAQHITELRCQKLYDWYDSITTQDSLSLWLKEYNNLVREVNQQVDSILKQNISPSAPEYHLYKTSLNKLTENIWIDYFYKNQNKLLTSPPALKIHNE